MLLRLLALDHHCTLWSTTLHCTAVNRHLVVCTLLLHGAHPDKADKHGGTAEMVAWRMDGGATEVLSEWVVDVDRELMEREAANREKGGKERGNVSSPGALDGLETSVRKRLHVKQSIDSNPTPTSTLVYTMSCSHSAPTPHVYQTHTNPLYPEIDYCQ